jgi:hypothetical protein
MIRREKKSSCFPTAPLLRKLNSAQDLCYGENTAMMKKIFSNVLSPVLGPSVYIDDYNGIASHFETLSMAFAIQQKYGHPVFLDWKELDAFRVEGMTRRRVRLLAKIGAMRLRKCDAEAFKRLGGSKKIICRCEDGPGEILDPIYLDTARKIKIRRRLAEQIVGTFNRYRDFPVVGLHIRRGDFSLISEDVYNPTAVDYPAVPLWWYEKVMRALLEKNRDVKFFLAATGSLSSYDELRRNFDVFTLDIATPYKWKGPGHQSDIHPVADLFALACCPVILATPVSGYAHWAANVLGEASVSLIPLKGASRAHPVTGVVSMYGQRMSTWRKVCRGDYGEFLSAFSFSKPVPCAAARTGWLGSATDSI